MYKGVQSVQSSAKCASPTCLIDIHSPISTAVKVFVSTALLRTLTFIHNGVWWGWLICAEALNSPLDPCISVALVFLPAPSDALSWGVIVSECQEDVWQHTVRWVFNALPCPGSGSWILTFSRLLLLRLGAPLSRGELRKTFWVPGVSYSSLMIKNRMKKNFLKTNHFKPKMGCQKWPIITYVNKGCVF